MKHSQTWSDCFIPISAGHERLRLVYLLTCHIPGKPYRIDNLKANLSYMIPPDFKNFYIGKNSLFFPGHEFVIKLSFPRVFVRYKLTEGYYSDFDKFFANIAEVQYLEGKRPSEMEHNQILTDIWNYITMENNPRRDDYISGTK